VRRMSSAPMRWIHTVPRLRWRTAGKQQKIRSALSERPHAHDPTTGLGTLRAFGVRDPKLLAGTFSGGRVYGFG